MPVSWIGRSALVCGLLALAAPGVVRGQTNTYQTNGIEYVIAGTLPGDQTHAALGIKSTGGYVVWDDNLTDGDGLGVSARRLDGSLSGSYSSFRVNATGAGDQELPQVGLLNDGGAVFVWQGGRRSWQHIYARFLSAAGTWLTPTNDVLVNTFTNNFQVNPAVAVLVNGSVAVTWGSFNQFSGNSMQDTYVQVLSSQGQKVGTETLVNQFTSYNQRTPAIAGLTDGRFVVAWISEQQRFDKSVDVYARIFNADGSSASNEIAVNTSTNVCANPSIAATPGGGFVIAWSERDLTSRRTNSWDISARAFLNTGTPAGAVVRVNQYLFGDQFAPKLAAIGTDLLAVWTSLGQDSSREGVYAQYLKSDLTRVGSEFRVNTSVVGPQIQPAVAADGVGQFLVSWSTFGGLTAGMDLYAQRYLSTLQPLAAPNPPLVTVLSSNALTVSWPAIEGLNVSQYEVYVDGAPAPTAVVTNTWWTMTGLTPNSTHRFAFDYVSGGRISPVSGATTNTTYGALTWGGIPYEWMVAYFGSDIWSWPSPYADTDNDGVSNVNEFLGGTSPINAASVLRVRLQHTVQGIFLGWNTEPGLIYQVQSSTTLRGWSNLGGLRFAPGTVDSMYVGGNSSTYYRVLRVR